MFSWTKTVPDEAQGGDLSFIPAPCARSQIRSGTRLYTSRGSFPTSKRLCQRTCVSRARPRDSLCDKACGRAQRHCGRLGPPPPNDYACGFLRNIAHSSGSCIAMHWCHYGSGIAAFRRKKQRMPNARGRGGGRESLKHMYLDQSQYKMPNRPRRSKVQASSIK